MIRTYLSVLALPVVAAGLVLLVAPDVSAVDVLDPVCNQAPRPDICDEAPENPLEEGGILNDLIEILAWATGIAAVLFLIIGAIRLITSSGDPNSISTAKRTILYALIGIVVAVAAPFVVGFALRAL